MDQLEKVKTGLECCAIGAECDHCPYSQMNDGNGDFTGCHQLHWDALELLKAEQPKKGHWEKAKHANDRWHSCSVCGVTTERLDHNGFKLICNYCPVCGADMRKGEKSNG